MEVKDMENRKLIDFYEFTMAYCDIKNGKDKEKSYFDVFFRSNLDKGGYNIACGLEEIIDYIKNLKFDKEDIECLRELGKFDDEFLTYLENFKFNGDIYAVPDGTVVFPGENCITVVANTIEAKLIETDILNKFNHGCLIATKARRIVNAARGKDVLEFGPRRAQGGDAAVIGAKNAYLAGCIGTSCYEAYKQYRVPLFGTMAHSHVMEYDTEYEAFLAYAKTFPNESIFLTDTIDTLKSGAINATKVAYDYLIPNGYRLKGARLDSGDLEYLSKETRKRLDKGGLYDAKIVASNGLDEFSVDDLLEKGAPIDIFGVGENLITAKSCPVFGGVYKLAAVEKDGKMIPKIKISNDEGKVTNPGYKNTYRFYDKKTGYAVRDIIALADEELVVENNKYNVRKLQIPIFKNGVLVYDQPSLKDRRDYCEQEVQTMDKEILKLRDPKKYNVELSKGLLELKKELLLKNKEIIEKLDNGFQLVLGGKNEKR
jgi:nicotinate phosphoribosyltransferase